MSSFGYIIESFALLWVRINLPEFYLNAMAFLPHEAPLGLPLLWVRDAIWHVSRLRHCSDCTLLAQTADCFAVSLDWPKRTFLFWSGRFLHHQSWPSAPGFSNSGHFKFVYSVPQSAAINMSTSGDFGNPLRKFKLVFLGEQSGTLETQTLCPRLTPNVFHCCLN